MRLIQHAFRLYLEPDRLDDTIAFYEGLQGIACGLRIALPQQGIDVAVVGAFVLLAAANTHSPRCAMRRRCSPWIRSTMPLRGCARTARRFCMHRGRRPAAAT